MLRRLLSASSRHFFFLSALSGDDAPGRSRALRLFRTTCFSLVLLLILAVSLSTVLSAQMVMDVDHEMQANKAHPPAATIVTCPDMRGNTSLPAGSYSSDLHVTGTCIADGTQGGGIYKYHWVYIHNGGTLSFQDKKLDLYASSILVLNGGALTAGTPDDNGAITGPLTFHLWGAEDAAAIPCENAQGNSDPLCGIDSTIWNSNPKAGIYPSSCKNMGYPGGDCFYQYDNPVVSDLYFGRKTFAISYGGTLQLFGKKGSTFDGLNPTPSDTGKSWTRLVTDLKGTEAQFDIAGEVDWKQDDHIVITATDYLPGHAEEAILLSDATYNSGTDTTTIKISGVVLDSGKVQAGGLRFPHSGTQYPIPAAIKTKLDLDRDKIETRAAVALLSRDIRIVSEGDMGPDTSQGTEPDFPPDPGNFFGGHLIFRQGFRQVEIQGVEFRQLGQGGIIGRYAVHFHMDRKVPVDTFVKDCSMNESMTRWITLHGTQGVLLARNVGWKSIGHGFYIEDGTETDNKLYANIGVLARGGVLNKQNPRQVPGILANKDLADVRSPFNSDWQHPSVFWIMNGWNDFQYNMAAGAGTCGICYWMTAAANSGPSRYEYWTGYASRQRGLQDLPGLRDYNVGTSPLETFIGNSCSTAMFSFMEVGNPDIGCPGFGPTSDITVAALKGAGPNVPIGEPPASTYDYYPITRGNRDPTACNTLNGDCGSNTDPNNIKCGGSNDIAEKNCEPTVLDHYTTAFNWAEKNFSSIWMRNWWKLITDSSVTDQLGPGLTMVTGGGYTRSDTAIGNWLVALRNVYVGQTQKDPANKKQIFYASDVGPFTPTGLSCDNGSDPQGYCLSKDNGISMLLTPFNSGQRMFNIYDGPSFQDSSAYLDIRARAISDCAAQPDGTNNGKCPTSKYMYAHVLGLLKGRPNPMKEATECYIPNAAIGWKQENGFYYPPAFYSRNLIFQNVDIRHFVIEPLFKPNSFQLDINAVKKRYCTYTAEIFKPFNDIDRQTVLNDVDGSLTGLLAATTPTPRETLSINEDVFFRAPHIVPECSSDKHYTPKGMPIDQKGSPSTAITSPFEYVSTAIVPACGLRSVVDTCPNPPTCSEGKKLAQCGVASDGQRNWTWDCTHCYGVPLFRQNWTAQDNADCDNDPLCKTDPLHRPGRITMMGQDTGQRSTLTTNQGWYYIDSTVPLAQQVTGVDNQNFTRSVFLAGKTYYVYLIYGSPTTKMKYTVYVGAGADEDKVIASVKQYRVNVDSQIYGFNPKPGADPNFIGTPDYNPMDGMLTVQVDMSKYGCGGDGQNCEFDKDKQNFCKPVSYCSYNTSTKTCGCKEGSGCKDDSVCSWGILTPDCPTKGCFAFSFDIQPQFDMGVKPGPPMWQAFPTDQYWSVDFKPVDKGVSGSECYYGPQGDN